MLKVTLIKPLQLSLLKVSQMVDNVKRGILGGDKENKKREVVHEIA